MSDLIGYGVTMWEKSKVKVRTSPGVSRAVSTWGKQVHAEETGYRGRMRCSVWTGGFELPAGDVQEVVECSSLNFRLGSWIEDTIWNDQHTVRSWSHQSERNQDLRIKPTEWCAQDQNPGVINIQGASEENLKGRGRKERRNNNERGKDSVVPTTRASGGGGGHHHRDIKKGPLRGGLMTGFPWWSSG